MYIYIHVCVCMCVCAYVCEYIYIYMYIYLFIYSFRCKYYACARCQKHLRKCWEMLGTAALHIFSQNCATSRSDSCANQEILILFYRVLVCQLEGTESRLQQSWNMLTHEDVCSPVVELGIPKKKIPNQWWILPVASFPPTGSHTWTARVLECSGPVHAWNCQVLPVLTDSLLVKLQIAPVPALYTAASHPDLRSGECHPAAQASHHDVESTSVLASEVSGRTAMACKPGWTGNLFGASLDHPFMLMYHMILYAFILQGKVKIKK